MKNQSGNIGIVVVIGFAFLMLMGVFLIGAPAMMGSNSQPIPTPVTIEKAEKYKAVTIDLGVPYDLVMLIDLFKELKNPDVKNLEDINPVFTALEFVYVKERTERYQIIRWTGGKHPRPIYGWVFQGYRYYYNKPGVLGYIHKSEPDPNLSASMIPGLAADAAIAKSDSSWRYSAEILQINAENTDFGDTDQECYDKVLERRYPEISEMDREAILDLFESHYVSTFYGEMVSIPTGPVNLPPITVGNVSRADLLSVATSIIGWPYSIDNGKWAKEGSPGRPLDCSGYVDWVYFQCFGKTVGGGGGTGQMFYRCQDVSASDLKIGDLGFYYLPSECGPHKKHEWNHVGIYVGSYDGNQMFIHCGGSGFGTPASPTGRVGVSFNGIRKTCNINPAGGTFSPAMYSTKFQYFKRPQFQFVGDSAP